MTEVVPVLPEVTAADFGFADAAQSVDQNNLIGGYEPGVQRLQIVLSAKEAGVFALRRRGYDFFGGSGFGASCVCVLWSMV